MDREEAARRLNMSTREVTAVREHPAGHVVTLSAGRPEHLITATVARRYVPDVDDQGAEAGAKEAPPAEEAPEPATPKRAARKGGA